MTEQQWGRVRIDADCPLRRGAWYRVTRLTSNEAVVDVNHKVMSVSRSSLQIQSRPYQHWTVDVVRTEGPGHGTELAARAARDGVARVVAVGGDGTVHDVANGLLRHESDVTLGVVPIGTGNDFAKLAGVYRHNAVRAVQRLVTAEVRRFDVGQVLGEWFVNSMGLGFGPAVVRVRNGMPGLTGFL